DGTVGDQVVASAFAVSVEHEDLIGVGGLRGVRGQRGQYAVRHGNCCTWNIHPGAEGGGVQGLRIAVEVRPGLVVVESGVEELARAQRGVSRLAEEMRQGDPLRM